MKKFLRLITIFLLFLLLGGNAVYGSESTSDLSDELDSLRESVSNLNKEIEICEKSLENDLIQILNENLGENDDFSRCFYEIFETLMNENFDKVQKIDNVYNYLMLYQVSSSINIAENIVESFINSENYIEYFSLKQELNNDLEQTYLLENLGIQRVLVSGLTSWLTSIVITVIKYFIIFYIILFFGYLIVSKCF